MRIAIDTGGTFTDCVFLNRGKPAVLKLLSTPDDPARSVLEAIRQVVRVVGDKSVAEPEALEIRHGTTIGTNALLERKGARVAFVTTAGFEDTIAIGRQARAHLYNWLATPAPCLVSPELRFGVKERVSAEGEVLLAPNEQELVELREKIRAAGAESVAISLLFSFANPKNETRVAEALKFGSSKNGLGGDLPISISHEILPEFREHERAATMVVNAYLAPKAGGYVQKLERAIGEQRGSLYVMQSSGGIISAQRAAEEPVRTVLSGPAGGLVGAHRVARMTGFQNIIGFDMGGTSTDVCLIDSAGPRTTTEARVAEIPISVPMLDIQTVGAGGGSLAWFDRGGILHVGPMSAGADPGPICYGRGHQATVTDANLALGRLDAELALAGTVRLDVQRTREIMERDRGTIETVEEFAGGIVRLCEAEMEKAIRLISVERGYDPREFTLVCFGGAGPLHACSLARALRIPRVLVPSMPGALSALGILMSEVVRDYSRTVMIAVGGADVSKTAESRSANDVGDESILDRLQPYFAELEARGASDFQNEGLAITSALSVDIRYAGQGYELNVPAGADMLKNFHAAHRKRYGHANESGNIEIVNVRVRVTGAGEKVELPRRARSSSECSQAVIKKKEVMCDGEWLQTPVLNRARLEPGNCVQGPAIVHEYSATTLLLPGCKAEVDEYSNIVIEV